jgi:hypothetical protein
MSDGVTGLGGVEDLMRSDGLVFALWEPAEDM